MFRYALLLAWTAGTITLCGAETETAALDRWIARQAAIKTLSADFTQTRSLRVLRDPVASKGRLYFQAPGDFRWEVGSPTKTIVMRHDDDIRVIEPQKKTVKVEAIEQGKREAGVMEFPFVKNRADLEKRFKIQDLRVEGDVCRLKLIPRDVAGFLTGVNLTFDTVEGHLLTLEMAFRDGSSMRNEFSNVKVNKKLPEGIFSLDTTGFQVIDAGR